MLNGVYKWISLFLDLYVLNDKISVFNVTNDNASSSSVEMSSITMIIAGNLVLNITESKTSSRLVNLEDNLIKPSVVFL